MNRSHDSAERPSLAGTTLVSAVQQVLEQVPQRALPALVVAVFPLESREIRAILSVTGVAACIANSASGDGPIDDCGQITATGDWVFPAVQAGSIVYLGRSREIRPRQLYEAMRHGIPQVVAMDAYGRWRTQRIPLWYGAYLVNRVQQGRLAAKLSCLENPFQRSDTKWIQRARDALFALRREIPADNTNERVLLVTASLGAGGAERQVVMTALSLARTGRPVDVLCIYSGTIEFDFYLSRLEGKVRVWSLGDILPVLFRNQNQQFEALLDNIRNGRAGVFLRQLPKPLVNDVVAMAMSFVMLRPGVVHLWQDHTNIVGAIAGLMAQVPHVVMSGRSAAPYHFIHHRAYMRRVYRLLLEFKEVSLLNNSEAGAASYARWLDVPATRVGVLHNGIDTSDYAASPRDAARMRSRWSIPEEAPLVGAVFRFSPEKDPMLWLDTAELVLQRLPAAHFVMIGDGGMLPQVRSRIRERGMEGRVCLPGLVDNMPDALAAMDVLLMTSVMEGLPNVLIEAQLAGCPVVATDAGGCRETVRQGDTGWIVEERSAGALAESICRVLSDDVWRARAAEHGPAHIQRAFGLERMLAETLDAYGLESQA